MLINLLNALLSDTSNCPTAKLIKSERELGPNGFRSRKDDQVLELLLLC